MLPSSFPQYLFRMALFTLTAAALAMAREPVKQALAGEPAAKTDGAVPPGVTLPLFSPPLSPRIANYEIQVRVDPGKGLLHGRQTLSWRNSSNAPVADLQFHLYLNGFRNDRSTFMRESSERRRSSKRGREGWGYIEIDSLTGPDGSDWRERTAFIQPDDDNPDDKTVLRLLLPEPLPAGATIRLEMAFTAKLPEPPIARTGIKKEFIMAGQWFPKIGVYENGAWNCHQFHANTEFYADFGLYDVDITVPREWVVGATGLCTSQKPDSNGTITHHYHAEDVHDFAWTASPDFVVFNGRSRDTDIRVLMQRDHASQGPRHVEAGIIALTWFEEQYGDYPYPNLTIVDPRRGADAAGGMEYPTLITGMTAYGMPSGVRIPELVLLHEFGHNYWYHLVASNEFEEAWLDEGINTFSEINIFADTWGNNGNTLDWLGLKINNLHTHRASYMAEPALDPVLFPAWRYYSTSSYGAMSYAKPGLALATLQNYLGRETMTRIMRTWLERWRFKHPRTPDFIAIAEEVSGQKLDWFFDQALLSTAVLDYSVASVSSTPVSRPRGFDFDLPLAADSSLKERDKEETAASDSRLTTTSDSRAKTTTSDSLYETTVQLRRLGNFIFPVEVELLFANGDTLREKWDGEERWKKYRLVRPARLLSATVDPDHKIPLDIQLTNNSRTLDAQSAGINKVTARLLFWLQFLYDMPQFLNLATGLSMSL